MSGADRRPRWPGADLPGRRIFYAVPIPPAAIEQIADVVSGVRAQGVPGGGRDVRWVRLDGLHLTLRFLGPTLDDRIAAAIRGAANGGKRPGAPSTSRSAAAGRFRPAAGRGPCGSTCAPARTDLVGLAR